MKNLLSVLNLLDGLERLNLVHLGFYATLPAFIIRHDLLTGGGFLAVCALIGLELWLAPNSLRPPKSEDLTQVQNEVQSVSKELRNLTMKLGFRQ